MTYTIVYIGATWCSTCKTIKPKTEELAKKFGIELKVLDYDDDLEDSVKETITKVPTLLIYTNDQKIQEYNVKQVESLEQWLLQNVSLLTDDF